MTDVSTISFHEADRELLEEALIAAVAAATDPRVRRFARRMLDELRAAAF